MMTEVSDHYLVARGRGDRHLVNGRLAKALAESRTSSKRWIKFGKRDKWRRTGKRKMHGVLVGRAGGSEKNSLSLYLHVGVVSCFPIYHYYHYYHSNHTIISPILWFCFVPFGSLSWNDFHIRFAFQKIDASTSKRINTPLRVSFIPEVVCKEGFEVLGECTSHDGIACAAHDPGLEDKVMLG